jgi:purine-binding chemotaxis protein CheW
MDQQSISRTLSQSAANSWVLFRLGDQHYGIRTESVIEMVVLRQVEPIPNAPRFVRGVVNLRGQVIPVVDLRKRLGLPSRYDEVKELADMLSEREHDHIVWMEELEQAVKTGERFSKTLDPHACAFGRWYDEYHPDNAAVQQHLLRFYLPHKRVHELGREALDMVAAGNAEEALALVRQEGTELLNTMKSLFSEARDLFWENMRELVIVIQQEDGPFGLIVDGVQEVRDIPPDAVRDQSTSHVERVQPFFLGIAEVGEALVMMLDSSPSLLDETYAEA